MYGNSKSSKYKYIYIIYFILALLMDSRIEDIVVEISSHVFLEENIDDHTGNTFCYFLPLQKRNHLPIKVLKFTTHIQNVHVLCRQWKGRIPIYISYISCYISFSFNDAWSQNIKNYEDLLLKIIFLTKSTNHHNMATNSVHAKYSL